MKFIVSCLIGVLLVGLSPSAAAIAFCDLRDPTLQIHDLFPGASSYRSLVEQVDEGIKSEVGQQLPFTLHNRELGKHTLYVALADEQPLGLVHVRSEASRWGLIEIVWSLSLDLTVQDFRFQRCRDRGCNVLMQGKFKEFLRNKSLAELRSSFGSEAENLGTDMAAAVGEHADLAKAVLRSAMKTLLVTELVWGEQLSATTPHAATAKADTTPSR